MSGYLAKFYGGPKDGDEFYIPEAVYCIRFPCIKNIRVENFISDNKPPIECFGHIIYQLRTKLIFIDKPILYEYVETRWN